MDKVKFYLRTTPYDQNVITAQFGAGGLVFGVGLGLALWLGLFFMPAQECREQEIGNNIVTDDRILSICMYAGTVEADGQDSSQTSTWYPVFPYLYAILAVLLMVPWCLKNMFEDEKTRKIIHSLHTASGDGRAQDTQTDSGGGDVVINVERTSSPDEILREFLTNNFGLYNNVLVARTTTNVLNLLINTIILFVLNMSSQGGIVNMCIVSGAFPDVIRCSISEVVGSFGVQEKVFGCHRPFNLYYRASFVLITAITIILTFFSLLTLVYNIFCLLPLRFLRRRWAGLGGHQPSDVHMMVSGWSGSNIFVFNFFKSNYRMEIARQSIEILARLQHENEDN